MSNMRMLNIPQRLQSHLVKMVPNPAVDNKLNHETRDFLHAVGLLSSDELGLDFTGNTLLLPYQLIGFDDSLGGNLVCLDIRQGGIIRWKEDEEDGFINSSVKQFVSSVNTYEVYLSDIQSKEAYGPFYSKNGLRIDRTPYAAYLTEKLREIDPVIFERGYYWPSFIERIELGL